MVAQDFIFDVKKKKKMRLAAKPSRFWRLMIDLPSGGSSLIRRVHTLIPGESPERPGPKADRLRV